MEYIKIKGNFWRAKSDHYKTPDGVYHIFCIFLVDQSSWKIRDYGTKKHCLRITFEDDTLTKILSWGHDAAENYAKNYTCLHKIPKSKIPQIKRLFRKYTKYPEQIIYLK